MGVLVREAWEGRLGVLVREAWEGRLGVLVTNLRSICVVYWANVSRNLCWIKYC